MESKHPISPVVFFKLKDGKYLTDTGTEVTSLELMANKHHIDGNEGYIILSDYTQWQTRLDNEKEMREALESKIMQAIDSVQMNNIDTSPYGDGFEVACNNIRFKLKKVIANALNPTNQQNESK